MRLKKIKTWLFTFLEDTSENMKEYFLQFGWMCLLYILISSIALCYIPSYFHLYLVVTLLLMILIVKDPIRYVYVLVGRRSSLKSILFSFLFLQFLFSGIYFKLIILLDNANSSYITILINTIYTGIITEAGNGFQKYHEYGNELFPQLFVINIVQIFLSWVYLGILISSLYQKFKRE